MRIKIIEKRFTLDHEDGHTFKDREWPKDVNAIIFMGCSKNSIVRDSRHATVVYSGLKRLCNGWPTDIRSLKRFGWNFGCRPLQDEENAGLVFGHLIKKDEDVVYFLNISHIDSKIKTMLQLAMEIVRQIELQI